MMYVDIDIIVDGALERSETFHDYLLFEEFISQEKEEAEGHGYLTEVYVVEHNHPQEDEECACVQYLTDHHPLYTWNEK
jgi:hypothetical protein